MPTPVPDNFFYIFTALMGMTCPVYASSILVTLFLWFTFTVCERIPMFNLIRIDCYVIAIVLPILLSTLSWSYYE